MPDAVIAIAELFEAGMLICFGFAWPVDVIRTLRSRRVEGKSPGFMSLILLGYLFGMTAKFLRAWGDWPELVTALYAFNATMLTIDIWLCFHFRKKPDDM